MQRVLPESQFLVCSTHSANKDDSDSDVSTAPARRREHQKPRCERDRRRHQTETTALVGTLAQQEGGLLHSSTWEEVAAVY